MTLRIANAIDLHCHYGPDFVKGTRGATQPYSVTAFEAARDAAQSGHAALVLKSHTFASPALAKSVEDAVGGLRVFGGICTDYPSGGLNLDAVESALMLGARVVWLPTVHSHQDYLNGKAGIRGSGIHVLSEDGGLLPEIHEIFALVQQYDGILATGHTTAAEHYVVAKEFGTRGKVVVTHAGEHMAGPRLTAAQCVELADLGAVIELTAVSCKPVRDVPRKSPKEVASTIRQVRPERCVLATDYGWAKALPRPAEGMREFLELLWGEGITEGELKTMVSTNPARLLGLQV